MQPQTPDQALTEALKVHADAVLDLLAKFGYRWDGLTIKFTYNAIKGDSANAEVLISSENNS